MDPNTIPNLAGRRKGAETTLRALAAGYLVHVYQTPASLTVRIRPLDLDARLAAMTTEYERAPGQQTACSHLTRPERAALYPAYLLQFAVEGWAVDGSGFLCLDYAGAYPGGEQDATAAMGWTVALLYRAQRPADRPAVSLSPAQRLVLAMRDAGITDRADGLTWVSGIVGRPVLSRADLTPAEVGRCRAALTMEVAP